MEGKCGEEGQSQRHENNTCHEDKEQEVREGVALEERVASVFVLLFQQLRQYLYFCTSQPGGRPEQSRR